MVVVEEDTPTSGQRERRSSEMPEELHLSFSVRDSPVKLRLKRSALVPIAVTSPVPMDEEFQVC